MAKVQVEKREIQVEKRPAPVEAATIQKAVKVCPRCRIAPRIYASAKRGAFVRKYALCSRCGLQLKWDESE